MREPSFEVAHQDWLLVVAAQVYTISTCPLTLRTLQQEEQVLALELELERVALRLLSCASVQRE